MEPVSADGAALTIVVNAEAGSGHGDDPAAELSAALPAAELVLLEDASELDGALRDAAARGARAIGIFGGDGSVNAAAAVALDHDLPLLVLPGGTLNHFARDLGIESVDDAVRAVRAGQLVAVDVGMIDGHAFLNTASYGSYSKLVRARERLEGKIGKWPALAVALVRILRTDHPRAVTIDGQPQRIWLIFVGNCVYDPPGFAPATRARLDDALFDVRSVDGSEPWARVRLVAAALTGRLDRSRVYTRRTVSSLQLNTGTGPALLAADGEIFEGGPDVAVEKHPQRLSVFSPISRRSGP